MSILLNDRKPDKLRGQAPAPVPEPLTRFLGLLFEPGDIVLVRPIETWTEADKKRSRVVYRQVRYDPAGDLAESAMVWATITEAAREERANLFFGVCPRFGRKEFDRAFQVRVVRVLWADLDGCAPEEALKRCQESELPRPTIVVRSGHGTHLYWLLSEPYLIDDAGDPPPVRKEWATLRDGSKKPRAYALLPGGRKVFEYQSDARTGGDSRKKEPEFPSRLSPKARHVQHVLQGVAHQIGGDDTHDLSRLLRLPGTLNRKDERSGKQPVPCEVVESDPGRRYPLSAFEGFARHSPDKVRSEGLAKIRLRKVKMTPGRLNNLADFINACAVAGDRSKADFALCCFAVRTGLDKEEVWGHVAEAGKFAERGRDYFDLTWGNAEEDERHRIFDRLKTRGGCPAAPGCDNGTPKGARAGDGKDVTPGPEEGAGEPSTPSPPPEADDDPHRLARLFLDGQTRHGTLTVRSWRGEWHRWDGAAYRVTPAGEVTAGLVGCIKAEFDKLAAAKLADWCPRGDDDKGPPTPRRVTTTLVRDTLQALASLTLLPVSVFPPAWVEPPVWLTPAATGGTWSPPFPPSDVLACRNELVHLPALVEGRPCHHPPTPRFFSQNALTYDFDGAAPPPENWLKYLGKLWPDDREAVGLLQEWFGYCLTPDTAQQKILLVIGPKRSGKGTLARVLRALVGPENVAGPTLSSLGTNFGLWPLSGKTLAVVSDARLSGGRADQDVIVERLLTISGEDAVTVDRKNLEPLTLKLTCRFVILTNELPRLGDSSGALPSRFLLLHTPRSWYGQEDPALTDRLLGELPGILLWAVEGWRRLRARRRFQQPSSGQELLEEVEDLSSPVGAFVKECCELGAGFQAETGVLYAHFKSWCEARGQKSPPTSPSFGRDLLAACPGVQKARPRTEEGRTHIYRGIRVRPGHVFRAHVVP